MTYFVTVGLGGALATLFRLVPLILGVLLPKVLGSTPRKVYGLEYKMAAVQFGALWPSLSLLCVRGGAIDLTRTAPSSASPTRASRPWSRPLR